MFLERNSEQPPRKGYTSYVHYGRESCSSVNGTSTVITGYLASSPAGSSGSGVDYKCLPKDPVYVKSLVLDGDPKEKGSGIQGVKYGLLNEENPLDTDAEIILKGVVCSVCLVEGRPSVTVLYDVNTCPDGWTEEYSGFLMSTDSANRAQYVCIDGSPESNLKNYMDRKDQSMVFVEIPSSSGEAGYRPVSCAVCSK